MREGAELWLWAFDDERLRVRFRGQHEYRSDSGPMVNLGEADGWASVHGNDARVIVGGFEDDCRITMRLVSDALEVAEEGHCGFGLNVTAAGTYRRASTDRPAFGAPAPALPPLPDARQRPSA